MKAATVENQKDRTRSIVHQPLEKLDKHRSVDPALSQHKAHGGACAHRRYHIHRAALAGASHYWGLALDAPRCPRMTVGSDPGFVAKIDLRPGQSGLFPNRRPGSPLSSSAAFTEISRRGAQGSTSFGPGIVKYEALWKESLRWPTH